MTLRAIANALCLLLVIGTGWSAVLAFVWLMTRG